jgi:hypothetical protein
VGVEVVSTDAQNLGIELFKARDVPLKSLQFTGSDRGKVGEVEGKDNVFFTENVTQVNGPLG